jgi:hypothetical protein
VPPELKNIAEIMGDPADGEHAIDLGRFICSGRIEIRVHMGLVERPGFEKCRIVGPGDLAERNEPKRPELKITGVVDGHFGGSKPGDIAILRSKWKPEQILDRTAIVQ